MKSYGVIFCLLFAFFGIQSSLAQEKSDVNKVETRKTTKQFRTDLDVNQFESTAIAKTNDLDKLLNLSQKSEIQKFLVAVEEKISSAKSILDENERQFELNRIDALTKEKVNLFLSKEQMKIYKESL
jgi:hypothetical protein